MRHREFARADGSGQWLDRLTVKGKESTAESLVGRSRSRRPSV